MGDNAASKTVDLTINLEKAFYILMKAREFDEKTEASGMEEGSNPSDDKDVAILEDSPGDATQEELTSALEALNEDEKLDIIALTWIGRGDFTIGEWATVRKRAAEMTDKHIPLYLLETPLFSDYLEEGLSQAGFDLDEFEREHF
ncbi:DUF3775 domain-containing protein [Hyphococcus luteus]|uniref:DUF3775 domain-containing protein n=1 Tax=Hyphococcus luteus TaxID=2058213 RepID=A0A2S7KAB4_9PROT|nr:DUF3775 domain-containing protein [Marinicaulis flavus]PQA89389.1 hypothetical protein CW354_00490 [Marinicaulis flavus]